MTSNPPTGTEAVAHFRTGPCSHTDSAEEKPLLDSAKRKENKMNDLGAPGRESSHAWHFVRFFFFPAVYASRSFVTMRQSGSSQTEASYFEGFAPMSAAAFSLCVFLARPPARSAALIVTLSNRRMFDSPCGRLTDVAGSVAEYSGAPAEQQ